MPLSPGRDRRVPVCPICGTESERKSTGSRAGARTRAAWLLPTVVPTADGVRLGTSYVQTASSYRSQRIERLHKRHGRVPKLDRAAVRWHRPLELETAVLTIAESQLTLAHSTPYGRRHVGLRDPASAAPPGAAGWQEVRRSVSSLQSRIDGPPCGVENRGRCHCCTSSAQQRRRQLSVTRVGGS